MKKVALMTLVFAALTVGALVGCEDKKAATPAPAAGGKAPTPPSNPAPAGGAKPNG